MNLKSSTELDPVWSPVINPVQNTGGVFSTLVPIEPRMRFFRLESN